MITITDKTSELLRRSAEERKFFGVACSTISADTFKGVLDHFPPPYQCSEYVLPTEDGHAYYWSWGPSLSSFVVRSDTPSRLVWLPACVMDECSRRPEHAASIIDKKYKTLVYINELTL